MSRSIYIIVAVLLLAFSGVTLAASGKVILPTNTLGGFLAQYVPLGIVINSTFVNQSYGSYTYTIMQINGSNSTILLVNTTNNAFSFVLNSSTAYDVLLPYYSAKYYPQNSTIDNLSASIQSYRAQSMSALQSCLDITGFSNYVCPPNSNTTSCLSITCQRVPICWDTMQGKTPGGKYTGIPLGFFGGLMNFSANYYEFNSTYNQYLSLSEGIDLQDIGTSLPQMQNLLSSLSYYSHQIVDNPIMPEPSNLSVSFLTNACSPYLGSSGGPYYCYSIGLCPDPNFNYTVLNSTESQINGLLTLPISSSSAQNASSQAVINAESFYEPIISAHETTLLNAFLNSTAVPYNSIVANLTFMSTRYKNSSISTALASLTAIYQGIKSAGISQNLTIANKTLRSAMSNASKVYQKAGQKYSSVYQEAVNSTAIILLRELDYQMPPPSLSALAAQQSSINLELNAQVNSSQLSRISSQASSLSANAKALLPPISASSTIKAVYGGAIDAMLASPLTTLSSKTDAAPLYASLLTFAIDMVVLVVIYLLTYHRLKAKKKLNLNPRVQRAWNFLFMFLFVLVLVDAIFTYSYAQKANAFLPASGFIAAVEPSNAIYIMTNSSIASNTLVQQCVSALKSDLSSTDQVAHVTVYVLNFTNLGCTYPSNASLTGTACFNHIISSNKPVIIMNPGNSSIVYRGLYGYTLYASGAATYGYACPLNEVLEAS